MREQIVQTGFRNESIERNLSKEWFVQWSGL